MVGRLGVFLVDTNVWLEVLLAQQKSEEAKSFLGSVEADLLCITELSLYSIGIIMGRLGKGSEYRAFVSDTVEESGVRRVILDTREIKELPDLHERFGLDFDDAYQYAAAEKNDLTIVSFDRDFDKTERGRVLPSKAASQTGEIP